MRKLMVCVDQGVKALPRDAAGRMVLDPEKMWLDPETVSPKPVPLEVGFMDGDPGLRKEVLRAASEWSKYANVSFLPSERPVQDCTIRISFKEPAAWSYLGTDARLIARDKPTMILGLIGPGSPQEEIQRVVLHEFGHALGCAHEHFHPAGGIPWNKEKVYAWYWENRGWDRQMVDEQVLFRYSETLTVHSAFDFKSIMLYPIDPELTDGKFHTELNVELSETDQQFIARMYPRPS